MPDRSNGSSAATVERAADVLLLFASSQKAKLGVTEIANELGISKTAVHRILSSLKNKGIVELDPISHRYGLGPVITSLGLTYLNRLDVRKATGRELANLSRVTNETATLSVRTGFSRVYVDQVTPDREVLMMVQIGIPYPLNAGASSKAFLAFMPLEEVESFLSQPLHSVTPHTTIDADKLRKELAIIRSRGWAQSQNERQMGAGSVAAPILDYHGEPIAVISVCGPAERLVGETEECVASLLDTTAKISARLGYLGVESVGS